MLNTGRNTSQYELGGNSGIGCNECQREWLLVVSRDDRNVY